MTPGSGPLEGLHVLDLSRVLAGPYVTQALGDMGARVIKIEEPGKGDDTRKWGPPFVGGESAYFLSVNRNKESVTLNLREARGCDILWRLVDWADVLVENFRPGTLEKLGFGWDALHARNPRLVLTQVSGYGQTGAMWQRPGYDLIAQGEGGIMSLTGEPGGKPHKAGVSQADIVAGMWALNGTLLALLARERTGRGQRVDASLFEGQLSLLAYQAGNYFATGEPPARMGNRHPSITPYETFRASDGWFNVGVGNEGFWESFCGVLGRADLLAHPLFHVNSQRVQHRPELEAEIAPAVAQHPVAHWLAALGRAGIPCGPVQTVAEALESDLAKSRDMVVELPHPTAGSWKMVGVPVKLSETPGRPRSAPPLLGEHTGAVLTGELGLSEADVAALRAAGVV